MRRAKARRATPLIAERAISTMALEPFMLPRRKPATAVEGSLLRLQLPLPGAPPVVPPQSPGQEKRR